MALTPKNGMNAKRSPEGDLFKVRLDKRRRLGLLGILLLELLNTTGRVNKHLLTGKERVGGRTHLDLDDRVLFAIRPFDGFLRFEGGTAHKLEIAGGIPENDFLVVGMNVFLHNLIPFKKDCKDSCRPGNCKDLTLLKTH